MPSRGSSPRMRGALQIDTLRVSSYRIIPADAGSTNRVTISKYQLKDHPRGCGEHPGVSHLFPHDPGSSPRMRGALMG